MTDIRPGLARPVAVLLACLVLLGTSYSDRLLTHISLVPSVYSVAMSLVISALLLPARWIAVSVPLAAGLAYGLAELNELKIAAIAMPITSLDVVTLFTDPSIVSNALGLAALLTGPIVTTALCVIGVALSVGVWLGGFATGFRRGGGVPPTFGLVSVVTLIVALGIGATCLKRYAMFAYDHARSLVPETCSDPGAIHCQAALSRRLGVVEYVAYT